MVKLKSQKSPKGISFAFFLVAAVIFAGGIPDADPSSEDNGPIGEAHANCSDGIDNDNDGQADILDGECDPNNPAYDGNEDGSS